MTTTNTTKHTATFRVSVYPMSNMTRQVVYLCTCGKMGTIEDGRTPATVKRARAAHALHVAAVTKTVTR